MACHIALELRMKILIGWDINMIGWVINMISKFVSWQSNCSASGRAWRRSRVKYAYLDTAAACAQS